MKLEAIFGPYYGFLKVTSSKNSPDNVFICSPFKHVLPFIKGSLSSETEVVITTKENSAYPYRADLPRAALGTLMALIASSAQYESFITEAKAKLPPEVVESQKKYLEALKEAGIKGLASDEDHDPTDNQDIDFTGFKN